MPSRLARGRPTFQISQRLAYHKVPQKPEDSFNDLDSSRLAFRIVVCKILKPDPRLERFSDDNNSRWQLDF